LKPRQTDGAYQPRVSSAFKFQFETEAQAKEFKKIHLDQLGSRRTLKTLAIK